MRDQQSVRFNKQIPPDVGPDGLDMYPFTVVVGDRDKGTQYAHWFDALLARDIRSAISGGLSMSIKGTHPSHDMQDWVPGIRECSVCKAAQDTDGTVIPCGLDIGPLTIIEAAREARLAIESGMP